MKLFPRVAATVATTIGLALAGVYFAVGASAKFAPEPPIGRSLQQVMPPSPITSSGGGTSMWWFALPGAMLATLLVLVAVRASRARRMMPKTI